MAYRSACASPRVARRRGASFFSTAVVARARAVRHRSRRRLSFSAKSWSQRRRASSSGRSPTLERSTASFDAAATMPSQARHPSRRAAAKAASGASSETASNAAAWAATPASTAASHSALTTAVHAEETTGVAPALNASTYVAASATKVLPRRAAPPTFFGRGRLNSRRRKVRQSSRKGWPRRFGRVGAEIGFGLVRSRQRRAPPPLEGERDRGAVLVALAPIRTTKATLEVLVAVDVVAVRVDEFQREIAQDPPQIGQMVGVAACLVRFDLPREARYEAETRNGSLVESARRVVDERRRQSSAARAKSV